MSDRFQFSQSKVKKWQQCRLCYHYRYVEGLKKRVKSRPLQFGSIVHDMLEAHANKNDPFGVLDTWEEDQGKLFAAEREMYGEIIEDIRTIMQAYFDYYENDKLRYIKYKGQYAEHWLEVPVGEEMLFVMKVDAFARTRNKLRWLTEHKTFKRTPSDDDRWRSTQAAVYIKACELLGMKPFDGILWNYVHSKPPTRPQILKAGGLSTRAINTLPCVIYDMVEELGLDIDNNQELLRRAEANVKNYFFRVPMPVNKSIVDAVYEDFIDVAHEMMEYHGKKRNRTIGMHCGWSCDFESICRAELTGGDPDFVKEREYESREDRDKQEKDEQEKSAKKKDKGKRKARRK